MLRAGHICHARARWNDGDDAGAGSRDFPTTAHKLEFPKFNGSGDPLPWLNRCERYFHVCRTPFYLLDDAQLWFH
jgi:hypothetical protein